VENPDLKQGSSGDDVRAWQKIVGATADGKFGPLTARATRIWQGARGLPGTGEVHAEDWVAAMASVAPPQYEFIQAKKLRKASRTAVDWVCIHVAECNEVRGAARNLAKYCAGGCDGRNASWHYSVDKEEIIQSVREEDIAYATSTASIPRGFDTRAIHIELAGWSAQTIGQWNDDYSESELVLCAKLVSEILPRWSIPVVWCGEDALRLEERGVTAHVIVTHTLGVGRTNHTDPGKNFDVQRFMNLVSEASEK
jgi:peptidoglycan hydrolase-like protein with peptidoglycan-binding domain